MKDSCHGGTRNFGRALAGSKTAGHVPQPFDSEKVPLILVSEVRRFLRVANQIEAESPRAAYLCELLIIVTPWPMISRILFIQIDLSL